MATREARLTMRLVDAVSGPARGVVGALGRVEATSKGLVRSTGAISRGVTGMGRGLRRATYDTSALSAGIGLGAAAAGRSVYQYEKMGNALEAVGMLTEKQRDQVEAYGKSLNRDFPFTNTDILAAAGELARAGFDFDKIMGSLKSTLNVGLAGDLGLAKTADIVTNVATAMRLPMETIQQVKEETARVGDALAYAATNSNTDIERMGTTFKYVAPIAAATGMSLEQLAASTMLLANNGIKGSDAGTGLRFALLRMLAPSKKASNALARLNIDLGDYVKGAKQIDAGGVVEMLKLDGIDATPFAKQIDALLKDKSINKAPAKLAGAIGGMLSEALGDESTIGKDKLVESLNGTLRVLGTQLDFQGFLGALRDKPDAEALLPDIFGVRHGGKIMALLAGDMDATLAKLESDYRGAADRMSKIRMKGVVGDWARLKAGVENFAITLADTGILADASRMLGNLTSAIGALGDVNPDLLKTGTYSVLALAGLAPLGLAAGGIASALGLLVNPLALVAAGAGYLAWQNWDKLSAGWSAFRGSFNHHLDDSTVATLKAAGEGIKGFIAEMLGMDGTTMDFVNTMRAAGQAVADSVDWIVSKLKGIKEGADAFSEATGIDLGWLVKMGAVAAVAGLSLGLVIGPIRALGKAIAYLSGIKLAWGMIKFLRNLGSASKAAKAAAGAATAVGAVGAAASAGGRKKSKKKAAAKGVAGLGVLGFIYNEATDERTLEERMAASKAQSARWNKWLETNVGTPRSWLGMTSGGSEDGAGPVITPKIDTNVILGETTRTADQVRDALNITAQPIIDTSSIDAAAAKALALKTNLASMGSVVGGNAARGTGTRWVQPGLAPSAPVSQASHPRRASGGPIRRGMTYEINERGTELLNAGSNGYITSNNNIRNAMGAGGQPTATSAGGTSTVTINAPITVHSNDPAAAAREIEGQLATLLARSSQLALDGRGG